ENIRCRFSRDTRHRFDKNTRTCGDTHRILIRILAVFVGCASKAMHSFAGVPDVLELNDDEKVSETYYGDGHVDVYEI
ncbi:hypothetical protein BC938DRAFT_476660, partial [Jimgerdemannia flammicorona]